MFKILQIIVKSRRLKQGIESISMQMNSDLLFPEGVAPSRLFVDSILIKGHSNVECAGARRKNRNARVANCNIAIEQS